MSFYSWKHYYVARTSDGVIKEKDFLDVLPKKLTLHERLPKCAWEQSRGAWLTPFKEVEIETHGRVDPLFPETVRPLNLA